ncbi:hypothetical protein B0H11DRAFT_859323 [Mycena galericulata]|nr:hypothetical protein B0H11DRAFT_859323 [Mycena galericulata]
MHSAACHSAPTHSPRTLRQPLHPRTRPASTVASRRRSPSPVVRSCGLCGRGTCSPPHHDPADLPLRRVDNLGLSLVFRFLTCTNKLFDMSTGTPACLDAYAVGAVDSGFISFARVYQSSCACDHPLPHHTTAIALSFSVPKFRHWVTNARPLYCCPYALLSLSRRTIIFLKLEVVECSFNSFIDLSLFSDEVLRSTCQYRRSYILETS